MMSQSESRSNVLMALYCITSVLMLNLITKGLKVDFVTTDGNSLVQ